MRTIKGSRKIFLLVTAIAMLSLLLTITGCKKDNPVVPPETPTSAVKDTINLNVEGVTDRSISVRIKMKLADKNSTTVKLYRKLENVPVVVTELPGAVIDTTIIDDDNWHYLQLDKSYSYYAISYDSTGEKKDTSNMITAKTLAPTSHNYSWKEYIIGEWQSQLKDVWGTDDNNVWAVGTFTINGVPYGIIKWDGTEWKPDKKNGGQAAIYGFSNSDIWTVGGGVFHYDGNEWKRINAKGVNSQSIPLDTVLNDNLPYTSVWGTSSNNLYMGNIYGKIIHWDGKKAEEIYDFGIWITDINGTSADNIWFTCTGVTNILIAKFNGNGFEEIIHYPLYPVPMNTTYPLNSREVYFAGNGIFRKVNERKYTNEEIDKSKGEVYKIRGTGANNIFAVGAFSAIYHFNGQDWKFYDEVHTSSGGIDYGVFVTEDKVFVVGINQDHAKAKILIGTKN